MKGMRRRRKKEIPSHTRWEGELVPGFTVVDDEDLWK
jgi:hypothetical protein